jgi:hypothetical protein
MDAIIGNEHYNLSVIDWYPFKVGERVIVIAKEFNTGEVTGMWCLRWIIRIDPIIPLYSDEDMVNIVLSPFRLGTVPLGLSGVQKSDNLENF